MATSSATRPSFPPRRCPLLGNRQRNWAVNDKLCCYDHSYQAAFRESTRRDNYRWRKSGEPHVANLRQAPVGTGYQLTIPSGVGPADCVAALADGWNQCYQQQYGIWRSKYSGNSINFYVQRIESGQPRNYNIPLEGLRIDWSNTTVPAGMTFPTGYSDGTLVRKFISTQAAIPASAFDSAAPITQWGGNAYVTTLYPFVNWYFFGP